MNSTKNIITIWLVLILPFALSGQITRISTNGHTVYHLKSANVVGKQRGIVSASFDGTVMCNSNGGKLIWENNANKNFPFDLAVADIDGDGLDETFVATAAGEVNAYKADGTKLWSFTTKGPLYQVCPIRTTSGKWVILTGGVLKKVYSLSVSGELISSIEAGDVVRNIRKGNILGDGNEYAVVSTTVSGMDGRYGLILLNPENLTEFWRNSNVGKKSDKDRRAFFSMAIMDINGDGKDEILCTGNARDKGRVHAFDAKGDPIFSSQPYEGADATYRMNLLTRINPAGNVKESIFGLFANSIIIYNEKAEYQSIISGKYDFTNATFDSQTSTYYLGSCASGGDGIYAIDISNPNWKTAFEKLQIGGKMANIEDNLATLAKQIINFKLPSYQTKPTKVSIIANSSKNADYENLTFSKNEILTEKYTDRSELWCKILDTRWPYKMSETDILNFAKEKEAKGDNFVVWAWHGSAVFMRPETMEKIIQVAPIHFQGFVCAEMEQTDSTMQQLVEKILYPLAEQCLKANKKIIFRNKGIYWNGTCYLPFFKKLLFNPKYSNVFVPALEETNCRTQEMSLAGRVGLWETGIYNSWSCRVVTDNACFNRMWEWSSQQIMTHYIRNMVLNASLGSDFFFIDIHQPTEKMLWEQLIPFYDLVNKGIVSIPNHDNLLSVSSLCLGMKSPPSDDYIRHGINGHQYNLNKDKSEPMVFDHMDAYWGASPLLDSDFSKYGYGADRRMLNFLPKYPYGLIAIVPDETDIKKFPIFLEKITTDGQYFYDEKGLKHEAADFKPIMLEKLKTASEKMPIMVKGDAAWSVVRIDPTHVRVTLVDPGYTDPNDREVEVILQHLNGISCTDILSSEKLEIKKQSIKVHIPAGIFRILDIEHK